MIGGGIMAGVALAGAQLFKDQRGAQKQVNLDGALSNFHADLVKIVHNANNCNATLQAFYNTNASGTWSNASINEIFTCPNCTVEGVDYNASATTIPTRTSFIAENQYISGDRTWMIKTLDILPPTAGTGVGKIIVNYELNPNVNGGTAKSVRKDININMRFDQTSRQFKECLSGNESSVNNLQHDICASMSQISSTGSIVSWDDLTQKCVYRGSSGAPVKTCPAGTLLQGVAADGTVSCKNVTQGTTPSSDLMLPSSTTCPTGQSVKLEIIDGKVMTRCSP